ncbi:MAG: yecA family protein [Desulforhopalus sp.]|jgi:yecA family protein
MLTKEESTSLKSYLALAPNPEGTFTFEELEGYLFGLAMTPGLLLPSEWVPVIFADETPPFDTLDQVEEMHKCLIQVYSKLAARFQNNQLPFPFNLEELDSEKIEDLYAWVSGFEEAITLKEELWDPEENDNIPEQLVEQLYHSLMTIQGLVDPAEVMDFFENMPKEAFQEVFPNRDESPENREMQVQMFLLASLPLAVETLQIHARRIENIPSKGSIKKKSTKKRETTGTHKANIINVDFGQKK